MRSLSLAAVVLSGACAVNSQFLPLPYSFADDPDAGGVAVSYTNSTRHAMCLLPEHWPNRAGWVDHGEGRVFLTAGADRFSMKHFNTGYCVGGCSTRVEPGATITSFIPYDHFDLPPHLIQQPKALEFSPTGYHCGHDQPTRE